jgi:hypothetical protein
LKIVYFAAKLLLSLKVGALAAATTLGLGLARQELRALSLTAAFAS